MHRRFVRLIVKKRSTRPFSVSIGQTRRRHRHKPLRARITMTTIFPPRLIGFGATVAAVTLVGGAAFFGGRASLADTAYEPKPPPVLKSAPSAAEPNPIEKISYAPVVHRVASSVVFVYATKIVRHE